MAAGRRQASSGQEQAVDAVEAAILEEEGADEWLCEPCEERVPKTLFDPLLPTAKEVATHNITHCPYRSWCKICVESRGREDAHKTRQGEDPSEAGLPEVAMDYDYYGDKEDATRQVTALLMKDNTTGVLFGNIGV